MDRLVIGCGYLGERVARLWRQQGSGVAALTRSPARADELRRHGIEPVLGDVMDRGSLRRLPQAETVLYAVGYDPSTAWSQREVAVSGLRNVLEAVASRTRRFVFISSTSVYGQSAGEWVDEGSPCEPLRENGRIVLEAEHTVADSLRESGPLAERVDSHVLRLAGLYGPGRLLRRLESLRAGEPIAGDPRAWLNLVHVDDAAAAVLACEERGRAGEVCLVCDDRPVRRREYFELLARLAGAPAPRFDASRDAARTPGLNKRCSNRKLREKLGLSLRYPTVSEGLAACGPL